MVLASSVCAYKMRMATFLQARVSHFTPRLQVHEVEALGLRATLQ